MIDGSRIEIYPKKKRNEISKKMLRIYQEKGFGKSWNRTGPKKEENLHNA